MGSVQLSDREATFVRLIVSGNHDARTAATEAGYHEITGYNLLRKPSVAAAVHEAIQLDLINVCAPAAKHIAFTLMRDTNVSARVRADISFKFMNLGGHVAPSSKDKAPEKQISEMSREELFAYIARNEAEISKIEGELADRATEVSAPVTRQVGAQPAAKPLDYLD